MAKVVMYTRTVCAYCVRAKNLLRQKGVEVEEINMDGRDEEMAALRRRTNWLTVPQIFINDQFIGGYDDMKALDDRGELDPLLKA